MASTLPHDNAVRWERGRPGGHVESYFLKATSPDGQRAIWLKHTFFVDEHHRKPRRAETWFVAFERGTAPRGAKITMPLEHASLRSYPFSILMGDATFDGKTAKGSAGDFRWHLQINERARPFRPFPKDWMYEASFPRSKTVTPTPSASATGFVETPQGRWEINKWPAAQGHNWGRSHAERWTWTHCNDLEGHPGTWFEAISARVKVAGVPTPWLSIAGLYHDGVLHRFDAVSSWITSTAKSSDNEFHCEFNGKTASVKGRVIADPTDVACLLYENPSGKHRACLNSKLARGQLDVTFADGKTLALTSPCFALEFGIPQDANERTVLL